MPIYEYVCQGCHKEFEALVLGREEPCCPVCQGKEVERKMSTFSHKSEGGSFSSSQGSGCSGCTSTNCSTCH